MAKNEEKNGFLYLHFALKLKERIWKFADKPVQNILAFHLLSFCKTDKYIYIFTSLVSFSANCPGPDNIA